MFPQPTPTTPLKPQQGRRRRRQGLDDWAPHVAKAGVSDRVAVRGSGGSFHRTIYRAAHQRRSLRDVRTENALSLAGRLPGRRIAPHLISSTALENVGKLRALRTMETILKVDAVESSYIYVYFGD